MLTKEQAINLLPPLEKGEEYTLLKFPRGPEDLFFESPEKPLPARGFFTRTRYQVSLREGKIVKSWKREYEYNYWFLGD